jgi:hypothetical protein
MLLPPLGNLVVEMQLLVNIAAAQCLTNRRRQVLLLLLQETLHRDSSGCQHDSQPAVQIMCASSSVSLTHFTLVTD